MGRSKQPRRIAKPANRRRGEVALPEVGEGVHLRFTADALERLHDKYGAGYLDFIVSGILSVNIKVHRTVLACVLEGADHDDYPWDYSFDEIGERILDALYLVLYRRTWAEYQEHEEAKAMKELAEAAENPQMAALLYWRLSSKQGMPPAYSQTKSEDSPPSKSSMSPESAEKTGTTAM